MPNAEILAGSDGQPLDYLSRNGFTCFFDKLQFGYKGDQLEVPMKLLEKAGIRVDRIRLPDGRGMNLTFWGELDINATSHFRPEGIYEKGFAAELMKAGIYYLQTDILAINQAVYTDVMQLL